MFCSTCGATITPGLSFCNRCGASLKERTELTVRTGAIAAFLTAITIIGIAGLGIMLGGALALKREGLGEDVAGMFMFMTFLIVCMTEFLLLRRLSRVTSSTETKRVSSPPLTPMPNELRAAQAPPRGLPETMPSVTENTTRTLEYSRNEPPR